MSRSNLTLNINGLRFIKKEVIVRELDREGGREREREREKEVRPPLRLNNYILE